MTGTSFSDRTLEGMSIVLDGKRFLRCKLIRCRLTYRGGKLPSFAECDLVDCSFLMRDAAANTLTMLGILYRNGESGLVDSLLAQLRGDVGATTLPPLARPQNPSKP